MTEEEGEYYPQPELGVPPEQSLAVIKHYSENEPFRYDSEYGDEFHVIAGEVPPYIKNYFYGFFAKDNVLTNMSEKEIALSMLRFKRARVSFRMSLPRHMFTHDTIRHLDNLENLYKAKCRRALHGFERTKQQTQIQEQLVGRSNDGHEPRQRRSFLGGIFGGP